MKEEITFDVNMKAKYMYRFMLYHNYTTFGSLFGVLLSLFAMILLITTFKEQTDMGKGILLFISLLWTIINPIMLRARAKRQVLMNSSYKKALTYTISGEGITVSQDENSESIEWDKIIKVVLTKNQLLVYSSKIHAFIFPLQEIGDKLDDVTSIVVNSVKGRKIKVTKKLLDK